MNAISEIGKMGRMDQEVSVGKAVVKQTGVVIVMAEEHARHTVMENRIDEGMKEDLVSRPPVSLIDLIGRYTDRVLGRLMVSHILRTGRVELRIAQDIFLKFGFYEPHVDPIVHARSNGGKRLGRIHVAACAQNPNSD